MSFVSILPLIPITFVCVLYGLGIYALVLLIKALKIYIGKNSQFFN